MCNGMRLQQERRTMEATRFSPKPSGVPKEPRLVKSGPTLVMMRLMLVEMSDSGYQASARRAPLAPPNLAPAACPSPAIHPDTPQP